MLNITESNIKNISQTLSKSRQQFSKNSWAGNSCIFNSVLSNSILLWNSRKLRLRADAQPWIFQDGTFLKMRFKKLHRTKKRVHREKLGDLFPIYFILYKTTFKVKNLIHRWILSRHSFTKSEHFFPCFLPPSPYSYTHDEEEQNCKRKAYL